jgi:hypothetical protein
VRAVKCLEAVLLAADVTAAVAGTFVEQANVAVAPHIHRRDGDLVPGFTHERSGDRVRYQLRAAVSTPGSAIARASRSAASEGCLNFDRMNFDNPDTFPSLSRNFRSGI